MFLWVFCVCLVRVIELHITAQSGPVMPSHSMPLALILPRGIKGSMILITCVCVY